MKQNKMKKKNKFWEELIASFVSLHTANERPCQTVLLVHTHCYVNMTTGLLPTNIVGDGAYKKQGGTIRSFNLSKEGKSAKNEHLVVLGCD
jgi:hypothetical protein